MVVADGEGVPLGVLAESATPHEVTLIEQTLDEIVLPDKQPERIVYDRAADSDKLRDAFERRGIELVCPHRSNRKKGKRQDGRKLRRYARRWKIERTIAWFHNFRRIVVRYEHSITMYTAFIHVACLMITLRKL
jgi:transposase